MEGLFPRSLWHAHSLPRSGPSSCLSSLCSEWVRIQTCRSSRFHKSHTLASSSAGHDAFLASLCPPSSLSVMSDAPDTPNIPPSVSLTDYSPAPVLARPHLPKGLAKRFTRNSVAPPTASRHGDLVRAACLLHSWTMAGWRQFSRGRCATDGGYERCKTATPRQTSNGTSTSYIPLPARCFRPTSIIGPPNCPSCR